MASGRLEKVPRADGNISWKIIIELGEDDNGKRMRQYKTVRTTKKEADRIMRDMLNDLQSNTYIAQSKKTLREWITEWYDTYVLPSYSPNTSKSYKGIIDGHIIPSLGHIKLQELTSIHMQKWYNELAVCSPQSNRVISPKTIRNIHMVLQASLTKAERLEMIKKNPAKFVQLPKCKKYVAKVYDQNQIQMLLNASKGTDMEVAVAILVSLGVRRAELLGLKYTDIDWEHSKIHIARSLAYVNREVIEKSPKTESSVRVITMPVSLLELLKTAKKDYMRRKLRFGKDFCDKQYIVCQENGKPYEPSNYTGKFKKFLRAHELPDIRLHDIRHTNATLMLSLGISPKVAQKRLGHSDYSTTMDIYSHILDDVEQDATDKLEESIFCPDVVTKSV